jgi:hypothetical protein
MRTAAVVILAGLLALGLGSCSRSESPKTGPPDSLSQWAAQEGFAGNERAVAGAGVFAQSGCLSCHTYLGTGSRNLGAPDLTAIGRVSPRTEAAFATYVADPSKFGNNVMPRFEKLGQAKLLQLGAFLRASKGPS